MRLLLAMTGPDRQRWGQVWHLAPQCEALLLELHGVIEDGSVITVTESCSLKGVKLGPVLMATQERLAKHCGLQEHDPPSDDPALWRFRLALPSQVLIEFVNVDERDDVDRSVWEFSCPTVLLPELANAFDRARAAARGHR